MATVPTELDWNSHKATIRFLYLEENRKLADVMEAMLTKYKFSATKAQYERHLRLWGFQKNKTKDVWETIALKITKRKREDKESEVFIGGEIIPAKKVKKEISRHGYKAAFQFASQSSAPQTPPGVMICTPAGVEAITIGADNLPILQFKKVFYLAMSQPSASAFTDSLLGSPVHPISALSFPFSSLGISPLPEEVRSGVLKQVMDISKITPGDPQPLHRLTSSLLPAEMLSDQLPSEQMILLTMFLISNNFIMSLHDGLASEIFRWLQEGKNTFLLKYLLSVKGPTVEALKEQIFRYAIEEGAVLIVKILLDAGMNPNEGVCYNIDGDPITPICCACYNSYTEVVEVLVSAGADPNKTVDGSRAQENALQHMLMGGIFDEELTQVLLNAKVEVNSAKGASHRALCQAAELLDPDMVDILLHEGATVDSKCFHGCTALFSCIRSVVDKMESFVEHEVIHTCGSLIEAGDDVNSIFSHRPLKSVLTETVQTGSVKLLRLILAAGAQVYDYAIDEACCIGDIRLAMLLVDARLNGANPVSAMASYIYSLESSPTADQFKDSDQQLRLVLEATSTLPLGRRKECLNSISQAASRCGRHAIVAIMRAAGADGPSNLIEAVRQKDTDLIQMFLEAGADVNERCSNTGNTALCEAIIGGVIKLSS